jgi:hypothetical protein
MTLETIATMSDDPLISGNQQPVVSISATAAGKLRMLLRVAVMIELLVRSTSGAILLI